MNLRTTTLVFATLLTLVFASCHKTTPSYHISWNYVSQPQLPQYVNQYKFAFSSDVPSSTAVQWTFGDGSTSTDLAPTHTYTTLGTYTITLTAGGNTSNTVTRVLDIYSWITPHFILSPPVWMKDSVIHFHSNVRPDSSFFWEFGDGSTSTDSTPSHTYTALGSYTVKLTVNGHASTQCGTTVSVINAPAYTWAIGGNRTWHYTTYYFFPDSPYVTITPHPDQSFAVNVLNSVQVQFLGRTLTYYPAGSTDSLLRYFTTRTDNLGITTSTQMYYYHYKDSITVEEGYGTLGAHHLDRWTTP